MRLARSRNFVFTVAVFFAVLVFPAHTTAQENDPCVGKEEYLINPDTKKPYTPIELKDRTGSFATISLADIQTCLEIRKAIKLHRIDFEDYAWMWRHLASKNSDYAIPVKVSSSVLFVPKKNGLFQAFSTDNAVRLGEFRDPDISKGIDLPKKERKLLDVEINEKIHALKTRIEIFDTIFGPKWDTTESYKSNSRTSSLSGRFSFLGSIFHYFFAPKAIFLNSVQIASSHFPDNSDFSRSSFAKKVFFKNSKFGNNANLDTTTFNNNADFENTKFGKGAHFKNAKFKKKAQFSSARFGEKADFEKSTFDDNARFSQVTFGEKANFEKSTFGKNANFSQAIFGGRSIFIDSIFSDGAFFSRSKIGDGAKFTRSSFGKNAKFQSTIFGERVDLSGTSFGEKANFSESSFGNEVRFIQAKFGEKASFTNTSFLDNTSFARVDFKGEFPLKQASFGNNAVFNGIYIEDSLDLREFSFKGNISFREAVFLGTFTLSGKNFNGRVDLRDIWVNNLIWDSSDRPSVVKGGFDLRRAKVASATIREVRFTELADFSDSVFGITDFIDYDGTLSMKKSVRFENLIFDQEADFLRSKINTSVLFIQNRFRKVFDLTGAQFIGDKTRLCLEYNRINRLILESKHLGAPERPYGFLPEFEFNPRIRYPLRESKISGISDSSCTIARANEKIKDIYASLQRSFKEAGDQRGTNEAWYLKTVAERDVSDSEFKDKTAGDYIWSLIQWIVFDIPSRNGIDLVRAIWVSLGLMTVFSLIYLIMFIPWVLSYKTLSRAIVFSKKAPARRIFRLRIFEGFLQNAHNTNQIRLRPFRDAFFLSTRAFLKLGIGTTYPPIRGIKTLSYFEWALGTFMLLHFLTAVKNTLPIALPFLGAAGS